MPVFPFRNAIVLRSIWTWYSMKNPFWFQKINKQSTHIFSSSISLQMFNLIIELIWDESMEFYKCRSYFRFSNQRKYPQESWMLINKNDVISISFNWHLWRRPLYIWMYFFPNINVALLCFIRNDCLHILLEIHEVHSD